MRSSSWIAASILSIAWLSACSDPTTSPKADVGDPDVVVQPDVLGTDVVAPDAATADVAATDTAGADVASEDTTTADVALEDTVTVDTVATDTTITDTAIVDTTVADSATPDTSVPDVAATDTAPTDTASPAPTPSEFHYAVRTPANPHGVTVGVTFDMPMALASLTANTVDTACTGALQLSFDNFDTCVRMTSNAKAHATVPNRFELVSTSLPPSLAPLSLRIDASVKSAAGVPMGWVSTSPPIAGPYHHTIVLDGTNDFAADEALVTSSEGHSAWLAWDADYIYLGFDSTDLAADNSQTWFVAYLGASGATGTRDGVLYNSQAPALPFDAGFHIQWRASDDYGGSLRWSGSEWTAADLGLAVGGGNVATNGGYLELRLPFSGLGQPDGLNLVMGMLREQAFNEASWAMVPATAAADGYDPDFASFISASLFYRNIAVAE